MKRPLACVDCVGAPRRPPLRTVQSDAVTVQSDAVTVRSDAGVHALWRPSVRRPCAVKRPLACRRVFKAVDHDIMVSRSFRD